MSKILTTSYVNAILNICSLTRREPGNEVGVGYWLGLISISFGSPVVVHLQTENYDADPHIEYVC